MSSIHRKQGFPFYLAPAVIIVVAYISPSKGILNVHFLSDDFDY